MRLLTSLTLLPLAFGVMLSPASDALAGAWVTTAPQAALPSIVHKVESAATRKQQELNKSCPPGKIYVDGKGCRDKEKAERKKQKDKE